MLAPGSCRQWQILFHLRAAQTYHNTMMNNAPSDEIDVVGILPVHLTGCSALTSVNMSVLIYATRRSIFENLLGRS
jgi:hypothetical protein